MLIGCISCGRDLHDECEQKKNDKCCCIKETVTVKSEPKSKVGTNYKADDEITVSAGRKRAAVLHQIDPERACEWRWRKNCGGGKFPIIGCLGGKQEHRHHGPVKNTARNETKNVHLICTPCHNRWHTLNDPVYNEEEYNELPHNPLPASVEECTENEIKWKSGGFNT